MFSAKDGQVAKKSAFWTAGLLIPLALGITLIGMAAAVLYPKISAEQAFPTVIKGVMPPVLVGLILAALLSAVMSSAVTCLLSASTILTVDVIHKFKPTISDEKLLVISKWGIIVLGLTALSVALLLKGIISSMMFAYTIFTAGLAPVVIAGFYKDKLKVTAIGALAAIIGGGATGLISKINNIKYLDLGALGISVVLLFTVSWIDRYFRKQQSVSK